MGARHSTPHLLDVPSILQRDVPCRCVAARDTGHLRQHRHGNLLYRPYKIVDYHRRQWHRTRLFQESELLLRLEMVACDGNCASLRPSEVALVLLCNYLDGAVNRLDASADPSVAATTGPGCAAMNPSVTPRNQMLRLLEFAVELQKICKVLSE